MDALNIYDKKSVHCYKCDRFVGEIDCNAVITLAKCGQCANPMPEGDDKILYTASRFGKPQSLGPSLDVMVIKL
ncbi:MAG: hypothetical protein ACREBI_05100 [Nitrosotalea sp.]